MPKIGEDKELTVIFHTNAGMPVLAGDMLLSVADPLVRTNLRLPSHPHGIVMPANSIPSYIPVKMRRKIFVVNDHLAVGTAGSALHIKMFLDSLFSEFTDKEVFERFEIDTFLQRYGASNEGQEVMEQIAVLIVAEATDWRGSLAKGLDHHSRLVSQRFGQVVTIGTGAGEIVRQIGRLDNNYQYGMSQPADGGTRFPEFGALACNLQLLANVYWKEFTSADSIFEAWGGAYDLIYQDSQKAFQNLKDYTIFLRVFDVDRSEREIQLMNVLKYERRAEASFIVMLNNGKLDFFGAKDITASDDPMSVSFDRDELTMNSQIHISIIAVGKGDRFLQPMVQIDGLDPAGEPRQTVFTRFDDEGRLCVLFHAEHDEWLIEQAIAYYESHAHVFAAIT